MTEPQSTQSPFARLVLFMVCLSIAGSLVAGVHWFAIDLPVQQARALHPPPNQNIELNAACKVCMLDCLFDSNIYACEMTCKELVCGGEDP